MQILADAEVEGPEDEPSFVCRLCNVTFPIRGGQIYTEPQALHDHRGTCIINLGDPVTYLGQGNCVFGAVCKACRTLDVAGSHSAAQILAQAFR